MKKFADQKRRELEFEVGDYVYLKLRPYRQTSMMARRNEKLSPKYLGPYWIKERVSKVAYRLALPKEALIHLVFHVSQPKKALGSNKTMEPALPPLLKKFKWVAEPEEVYGYCKNPNTGV